MPDLSIDGARLAATARVVYLDVAEDSCLLAEGCVGGAGRRRLLEFDMATPNLGAADLILGDPVDNTLFHYSACHNHYHIDGYAIWSLNGPDGTTVVSGQKQSFCLADYERYSPDAPTTPRYSCGYQGIQAGWADVYVAGVDCNWIDVTGVPAGTYTVDATVNFEWLLPEADYTNNSVSVSVELPAGDSGG